MKKLKEKAKELMMKGKIQEYILLLDQIHKMQKA